MYHSKILGCIPTCLCFILHIRNKFPIPLCLKTHDINDCGFSPILSTYLFKRIVATSVIEQLTQRQTLFIDVPIAYTNSFITV